MHFILVATQKNDIQKTILAAALHYILRCLYAYGVKLSNIYNYFRNKDEIFNEKLSELSAVHKSLMNEHNNNESIDLLCCK